MPRRRVIRKSPSRPTRAAIEAAFCLVLLLAVLVGGGSAISGLPQLASLLVPPGLMEAKAREPAVTNASFAVDIPASGRPYATQVLEAGQGFPDWLEERVAFFRDARRAQPAASKQVPAIAIVIDDLGADAVETKRAIALPRAVSLSFLPYPDSAPGLAREARRAGHQILVHMPMEPDGNVNPGPNALLTSLTPAQNLARLEWALSRIPGYSGINNHEGSRFTANAAALAPIVKALAQRHVFFLDSRTTAATQVVTLSRAMGVPSAGRDVFLDDVQSADAIDAELARTEALARANGVAIAIGHPHPATMEVLARWCASASVRGYSLVTAGVAIDMHSRRDAQRALAGN